MVDVELLRRVLDALDSSVLVMAANLDDVLFANRKARSMFGNAMPRALLDGAAGYIAAREDLKTMPPALRIELNDSGYYLRAVRDPGRPPIEIVFVREEVVRDPDLFRALNARFSITRREFQIVQALRLGKTNRQIATEVGLAEPTIARHVARLLERIGVPNRTRLVNVVEGLVSRRA